MLESGDCRGVLATGIPQAPLNDSDIVTMLKALELAGFKSFADNTRFEFPPGITVVVGPNGSGKSNIVDAMKWVLGEQSARSLRGKEMADVIFKGSGSGHRKPANTAEATIVFDNANGVFGHEASEIRVTRRVYRSGEGEYLINGQACRLRDIKDMFRGTGVGTDAYSLIEQGKVDSLLQASAKDRRAIFEEAAGISRFKVKKIEAQRRLDRVDQNLLRLSDIVDEVDSRLRRLKSQAGKARRYQEYATRLQELRTHVGRFDWQRLTTQLDGVESEIEQLQETLAAQASGLEAAEARAFELETEVTLLDEQLRDYTAESGRHRERIAAGNASMAHERQRVVDLEEELTRQRLQLLAMTSRAGDLQSECSKVESELAAAHADHRQKSDILSQRQSELQLATESLASKRATAASQRDQHLQNVRAAADLTQQITRHQSQLDASVAALESYQRNWTDYSKSGRRLLTKRNDSGCVKIRCRLWQTKAMWRCGQFGRSAERIGTIWNSCNVPTPMLVSVALPWPNGSRCWKKSRPAWRAWDRVYRSCWPWRGSSQMVPCTAFGGWLLIWCGCGIVRTL